MVSFLPFFYSVFIRITHVLASRCLEPIPRDSDLRGGVKEDGHVTGHLDAGDVLETLAVMLQYLSSKFKEIKVNHSYASH